MKKKSRNKHLLKKRRAKAAERAILEAMEKGDDPTKIVKTVTPLYGLHVGDEFEYKGHTYTVADPEEVGGFIACINNSTGEQEWVEADTDVA